MIGAKRDFLDPTEMCLFNGYIITAFSTCGVFAYITDLLDSVINQLKKGEKSSLPTRNMSSIGVVTSYPFANPYSRPKAMAALNILQDAGKLNVNGCFIEKTRERSIIKVNAAHEMVRQAAKIADEVRELEKTTDHVVRNPHGKDGEILHKKHFFDEAHKEQ